MKWIVSQLGAREHYAIPVSFHRLGHLRQFYTDAWCHWGRGLLSRGPGILSAYANRYHPSLPRVSVKSFTPSHTAFRLRSHLSRQARHGAELFRFFLEEGAWFGSRVAEHLSRQGLDAAEDHFFAFNTGALEALRHLQERRIFTVVDQIDPGVEEERLVALERQRWPGWEENTDPIPPEYWNRIREEWCIADLVLVNSEWSKGLLLQQGVPESKLIVVGLGYESPCNLPCREPVGDQLTVLWLGTVMVRKGFPYLVEAARKLPKVRFVVAGPISIREEKIRSAPANMTFLGRVQRHNVGRLYQKAHVFVLPTISDGFGITQLEAMAHGLPVIATSNCGRVVTHGSDGLIIPAAESEALACAIARLDANRKELSEMSRRAAVTARAYSLANKAHEIEEKVARAKVRSGSRSSGRSEEKTRLAIGAM